MTQNNKKRRSGRLLSGVNFALAVVLGIAYALVQSLLPPDSPEIKTLREYWWLVAIIIYS